MTTRPDLLPDDSVESFTAWPLVAAIGFAKLATLIEEGVIEYVDVNEENNCLISLNEGG